MFECVVMPESYKLRSGRALYREPLKDGLGRADLFAVRNSFAAFQLVFDSDAPYAVNVGSSMYISQKNSREVYRVAVQAPFPAEVCIEDMHTAEYMMEYADALLSCGAKDFDEGSAAVWIEMKIPKDTVPGVYSFTVKVYRTRMFAEEELVKTFPGTLEVAAYTLPETGNRKLHLDLWQHLSNIARAHETPLWSNAHFAVLEGYAKSLGELGQKAVTVVASETPWCGQSCAREKSVAANMYEYSIIPVVKGADGVFRYDFSKMQRYIDLCAKYGIDREISVYGLCNVWGEGEFHALAPDYPDGMRIRYFDEAEGVYRFMTSAAEIEGYIRALEAYFLATNQMEKVRLAADEPGDVAAYRKSVERLKKIAPSFRLKAAINHASFIEEFHEEISDFVPYIACLAGEFDRVREYRRTLEGKRFLWYLCCGPESPNTFLRSPLTDAYAIGVLTSLFGMDGFLRWSYTDWTDDPRREMRYPAFPAGDIALVYPARSGQPLLSLRYKALKRGFELYEMLEELRSAGKTDALEAAFDAVLSRRDITTYAQPGMWSENYDDYREMLRIAAGALVRE